VKIGFTIAMGQMPSINGITIGSVDYPSKGRIIAAILQPSGSIWVTVEISQQT